MLYFELLGLPGAGKTTLLRRWDQSARVMTIHQLIRRERLRSAETHHRSRIARRLPTAAKLRLLRGPEPDHSDTAAFVVDQPDLHALVCDLIGAVPAAEDRQVALWMLFESWARFAYARRFAAATEGVILDEGIWQRLAWLLAVSDRPDRSTLPALPERLPQLDGLVVLDLPLELASARVTARGSEFQAIDTLPALSEQLDRLVGQLRDRGTPVLILDARLPREALLADLHRFVA
jgi:hypothetical protein